MDIVEDTPRLQKEIENKLAFNPNEVESFIDLAIEFVQRVTLIRKMVTIHFHPNI